MGLNIKGGKDLSVGNNIMRQLKKGNQGYADDMSGKTGREASFKAGVMQSQAADEARALIESGYDSTGYAPYIAGGTTAYNNMVAGSTPEGYSNSLNTLSQSPMLQQLIAMKERGIGNQLSTQGLNRSGYGVNEIAQVQPDTLMALENEIYGRQAPIANTGFTAMQAKSGLDVDKTNALTQMILQKAGINATSFLNQAQSGVQGSQNKYTMVHNVGSGLMSMFGGMGGGGETTANGGTGSFLSSGERPGYNEDGTAQMDLD